VIRICAHIYDKMELSRLDRPDWNGNLICINHLYGNKICLKHPKISPVLQINGHLMVFQTTLQKYFKIFLKYSLRLNSKSHTGRCHMIYWCFLIVCHLSLYWNLHCVNILSVDIPKNCNLPPETFQSPAEYWTFQLTSHGHMFLFFFMQIDWYTDHGEVFWKVDLATGQNSFQRILSDSQKKHWNSLIPLVNFYRCHMWCFRWI